MKAKISPALHARLLGIPRHLVVNIYSTVPLHALDYEGRDSGHGGYNMVSAMERSKHPAISATSYRSLIAATEMTCTSLQDGQHKHRLARFASG